MTDAPDFKTRCRDVRIFCTKFVYQYGFARPAIPCMIVAFIYWFGIEFDYRMDLIACFYRIRLLLRVSRELGIDFLCYLSSSMVD